MKHWDEQGAGVNPAPDVNYQKAESDALERLLVSAGIADTLLGEEFRKIFQVSSVLPDSVIIEYDERHQEKVKAFLTQYGTPSPSAEFFRDLKETKRKKKLQTTQELMQKRLLKKLS